MFMFYVDMCPDMVTFTKADTSLSHLLVNLKTKWSFWFMQPLAFDICLNESKVEVDAIEMKTVRKSKHLSSQRFWTLFVFPRTLNQVWYYYLVYYYLPKKGSQSNRSMTNDAQPSKRENEKNGKSQTRLSIDVCIWWIIK